MEMTAALSADLALLSAALDDPAADFVPDVAGTVRRLAADARLAVPSFVGLTVTVTVTVPAPGDGAADRVALRFTVLDDHVEPGDIRTSLRLPRPTGGAGTDRPGIAVILYAAPPGAFVDMAADVSFMTGRTFDAGDLDQHQRMAAEADITGALSTESTINEAIGVLIDRGHTPEQAYAELDALADAAHTDRITEAAWHPDRPHPGRPRPVHARNAERRAPVTNPPASHRWAHPALSFPPTRRVGLLVATFQPAWVSRSAFNGRRERVSAHSQAHSASQAHACGRGHRTAVTSAARLQSRWRYQSSCATIAVQQQKNEVVGAATRPNPSVRRARRTGPPNSAVTEPWKLRAATPIQYRRSRPRKGISMSRQHHEHPTQSVAPGAEPAQSGDNPPPHWVNPARAAAAEFAPQPANPHRRPHEGTATGHETPE